MDHSNHTVWNSVIKRKNTSISQYIIHQNVSSTKNGSLIVVWWLTQFLDCLD
ncbi:hypothetical protein CANARDRAFT_175013 [[Candida] arabinofermentans NRRL YB-2248]|uniref:Uncharacterized protein n=1 Tax=[Candida] arabinofermentans NRRL YB-2248 TaxID=983967 RepID=A0A1E4T5I2_9ASCO|nr:hypothetical protein CANARDRAFT_175013 [[Candida] arabinofermentans NRRL YB-2248]